MKGLLCWLGMLSGSTTEPAPGTKCLLCLFLGCQETGVGTEGQLGGGQAVTPWPGLVVVQPALPRAVAAGSEQQPFTCLHQAAAADAAISRVQSECLLPRLTWVLSSLQRGL